MRPRLKYRATQQARRSRPRNQLLIVVAHHVVLSTPNGGRQMPVKDVLVVSVPVSDQERAKAFYIDVLGLELRRDDASIPGMRWVQVGPKGSHISLTLVTWFES